ncbi:hypothetical protein [Mesorhizobium escarrei]|uniref:hypothetical protein n=1 Tax=Mesorhizobium escarrei TaxID=666018 RepID=UPI0020A6E149|nr:hypothetical protein [Mesorhizobium escarrei]
MATIRGLMPDASLGDRLLKCDVFRSSKRGKRLVQSNRVDAELQKAVGISANDPRHQVGRDWFTISGRSCDRAVETFVASLPIQIGPQLVGLAGKQFIAGSGNIVALNCGEPDHPTFSAASHPVDAAYYLQCGPRWIGATGKVLRKGGTDRNLLISNNVGDQLRRVLAQPGLSRKIARIPTKNDLKARLLLMRLAVNCKNAAIWLSLGI